MHIGTPYHPESAQRMSVAERGCTQTHTYPFPALNPHSICTTGCPRTGLEKRVPERYCIFGRGGHRTESRGHRAKSGGHRTKSGGHRTKSGGHRTKSGDLTRKGPDLAH
eukprot:1157696-Pelagomonas_calceolata.AAC.6